MPPRKPPSGGSSCQKSPAKSTLRPPKGLPFPSVPTFVGADLADGAPELHTYRREKFRTDHTNLVDDEPPPLECSLGGVHM